MSRGKEAVASGGYKVAVKTGKLLDKTPIT